MSSGNSPRQAPSELTALRVLVNVLFGAFWVLLVIVLLAFLASLPVLLAISASYPEFVLKRTTEPMPWGALLVPILCAFGVLLCIVVFRRRHKLLVFGIGSGVILLAGVLYLAVGIPLRHTSLGWLALLIPILVVAFIYICVMYVRDSHTVPLSVAGVLGMLRMAVYCLLAVCFLLPGCQEFETTITESKVLVLFDISASMDAADSQDGDAAISRQEKIIAFLTKGYMQGGATKTFMEHLTDNTPVSCYRFGTVADDEPMQFDGKSPVWTEEQWRKWFRPDKIDKKDIVIPETIKEEQQRIAYVQNKQLLYAQLREGTDVGGSVLQVLQREGNNRIQAIIVFSDGNSNRGDEEAIRQLLELAGKGKRPIHVMTVGVGDYKQPVRIRVNPLIAPQAVRADDGAFEVRVPVFGDGLPGEEFEVTLLAERVKDRHGVEVKSDKPFTVGTQKGTFGGAGEFPYDEVVFKVNLEELTKIKADNDPKNLLQGTWNFTASVPRHPREAVDKDKPNHVSQPKVVMVNDSTLRVLLFASGPSREYIYVKNIMAREVDAKRAKLTIHLQTAVGLDDVQQDSLLIDKFPNKLERPAEGKKDKDTSREGDPMNLKSYDVIICFDPDWSQLDKNQKDLLKEWVEGDHGGGIIFVAGPQHTLKLIPPIDEAKFNAWDMKSIYSIFPVIMARPPQGAKADSLHDATIPYSLEFTPLAKGYDFLKLNDDDPTALGGWKEFYGKPVLEEFPGGVKKLHYERGFYNYFRLRKVKDGAEVIATFGDDKAPKMEDNKDQAYFVSLRVGKGKSFYIGSGEPWRLRTYKEEFHVRFWVKLARFVSSGSGSKSFGRFSMAGEYVTGDIPVDAEVRDKDGFPLSKLAKPVVTFRKLEGGNVKDDKLPAVELAAKEQGGESKWRGTFRGTVRLENEGLYEARIDIPGTEESITQTFEVKVPNVEMADLRTNFPKLYGMATDLPAALLDKLDPETRARLEGNKDRAKAGESVSGARLFFLLPVASSTTQCIVRVPADREKIKGASEHIWTKGAPWPAGPEFYKLTSWRQAWQLAWAMFLVPAGIMGVIMIIMLVGQRWLAALGVALALVVVELAMLFVLRGTTPDRLLQPSFFSVLLVGLPLFLLAAAGIMLLAERYFWSLGIFGGAVLCVVLLVVLHMVFKAINGPEWTWPVMKVDFTYMTLLIGALLSVEWFMRKMLRLA